MPPLVSSTDLIAAALREEPLNASPSAERYRARVVYGDLHAVDDVLGMPAVNAAARALGRWVERSTTMPSSFWRDASVRVSTLGKLHIKLVLQAPTALGEFADANAALAALSV